MSRRQAAISSAKSATRLMMGMRFVHFVLSSPRGPFPKVVSSRLDWNHELLHRGPGSFEGNGPLFKGRNRERAEFRATPRRAQEHASQSTAHEAGRQKSFVAPACFGGPGLTFRTQDRRGQVEIGRWTNYGRWA